MKNKSFKLFSVIFLVLIFNYTINAQSPSFDWVKSLGGPNEEVGYSIDVDPAGNVCTTGYFTGIADFDPGSGTYNLSTGPGLKHGFVSKLSPTGAFLWAKKIYPSINANGGALSILKTDAAGNIFVLSDDSITKLSPSGSIVWAKSIGGRYSTFTIDNIGNLFITGLFSGVVDFNTGVGVDTLRAQGYAPKDVFVLKIDNNGNFIWAKSFGCKNTFNTGQCGNSSSSIAVSSLGNVYVAGEFIGIVDFNPSTPTYTLGNTSSDTKMFVLNLNSSGDFVWANSTNGGWIQSASIGIDANQNVYLTGGFAGSVFFPDSLGSYFYLSSSNINERQIFLSKYNSNGNLVWAKSMGGSGYDFGISLNLDASNNVCAMGRFQGIGYFNIGSSGYTLTASGGSSDLDVFLVKYDENGNFIWGNSFGGPNAETGHSMVNDALGNIYLTGSYSGVCDFDPNPTSTYTINSQVVSSDAYVLKLANSVIGIRENEKDDYFTIYPNPNNGMVIIKSITSGTYELINTLGQTIKSFQLNSDNNFTITIDELPDGIYYVLGKVNNQTFSQKIIVIQ